MAEAPYVEHIEPRVVDADADAAELQARIDTVARGGARAAVLASTMAWSPTSA